MLPEDFSNSIVKQATRLIIGGFRPTESKYEGWFGKILVQQKDESWPEENGKPFYPLCQINLTEIPYKPEILSDIEFITIFISDRDLPWDSPNGKGWLLRAYSKIDDLIPINNPPENPFLKPFQMRSEWIEKDFPCHEDYPVDMPEEIEETYHELFPNVGDFKIGGWPTHIQSGLYWDNEPDSQVKFAFQIDSAATGKSNFGIGDSGIAYFGREKNNEIDEWYLQVQTM